MQLYLRGAASLEPHNLTPDDDETWLSWNDKALSDTYSFCL